MSGPGSWWRRLVGGAGPPPRDAGGAGPAVGAAGRRRGFPTPANGASSFHLRWELPAAAYRGASVTLEVLEPPTVPHLYFWALQVDWVDGRGRHAGGAHLGLQWFPPHPGSTAVNWGGYDHSGRELDGSASPLPSATGNPNTRDLAWRPGVPYRLAIAPAPDGAAPGDGRAAWRGTVTGPDGSPVVVRDLWVDGAAVSGAVMWSEVFARCDDPPAAVRWSAPEALAGEGGTVAPGACRTTYQSAADGGCADTDSGADAVGLVQRTSTPRSTPAGAALAVPPPRRT